jgi:hypothetical protein
VPAESDRPADSAATNPAPAETSAPTSAAAAAAIANVTPIVDLGNVWKQIGKLREPTEFRVSYIRPDDLLVCDFVFDNLRLETAGEDAPKLIRANPPAAATLIVELPPQSFGEQAFLDDTGPEYTANPAGKERFPETSSAVKKNVASPGEPLLPLPSAKIRMAGRSRIAFTMPADETELAFAIEAILDACRRWPMRLDVNAVADAPVYRLPGFAAHDEWLASVVSSPGWVQVVQELIGVLGGTQGMQKSFSGAARRVATKAIESTASGTQYAQGTDTILTSCEISYPTNFLDAA